MWGLLGLRVERRGTEDWKRINTTIEGFMVFAGWKENAAFSIDNLGYVGTTILQGFIAQFLADLM